MFKIVFFLFSFTISSSGYSQVKVVLFDVAPFSYMNEKGELDGVIYKLCSKIEESSGLKFTYNLVPYPRAIRLLKEEKADLGIFYPSYKFKNYFDKLTESLGNINYIISLKSLKLNSIEDILPLKIGILRGAKYSKSFDDLKKPRAVYFKDYETIVSMLLLGRIDTAIISHVALEYYLREKHINSDLVLNKFKLSKKQSWIHVRNNLPTNLRNKLIKANSDVLKNEKYSSFVDLL